ncbi:MAG: glycoside hydrolase family 127 protein [Bacteroidota bacterium]|nr:glycoside hydrolase family 127 protein [Bacteroidota bacterium]
MMNKSKMRNQCKTIVISVFILLSSWGIFAQNAKNEDFASQKKSIYLKKAKVLPAFIPLEIGEIRPTGWLKDWATDAAKGITGHLDEYVDVFKHGWKGYGFKARGVKEDGTGWPLEQCSYWLDGAVKLGYILHDTALIHKTSSRLNYVVNGVLNGGETFIYWKPKSFVNDDFNNWGHGLMGRALVSYYQATHDPKILQALVKVYQSFPIKVAPDSTRHLPRGATNIDAMTETYLISGQEAILDSIIGYSKKMSVIGEEQRWLRKKVIAENFHHGVSFYELMRVPAMMYFWTGDKTELNATNKILEWGEEKNLLPVGICSSEEFLAGIGSFRNIETCNVPTSMWSFLWMMRLTGERSWGDRIEKIFFNAGPAPIARDFKTMCYYQSLNRFSNKMPEENPIPGSGDLKFTDHGHDVLCCVGNVNNIIPDYISGMWMETMDNGLAATLYGPCILDKMINHAKVSINCKTNYPFDNNIKMTFKLSKNVTMPIYLRIPEWCNHPSVKINGKVMAVKTEKGFMKILRAWKSNDQIQLDFPMSVQVRQGKETSFPQINYFLKDNHYVDAVDTTISNPFEYVTYGPLLFSLPIADVNPNQEIANARFNYALDVNAKNLFKEISVTKKPLTGKWAWQLAAPIQLKVKATAFNWIPTQVKPLPESPIKNGTEATINLVPYGCTKFRVAMFPVTQKSWNSFVKVN